MGENKKISAYKLEQKWTEMNKSFLTNTLDFNDFIILVKETAYFLSDYMFSFLSSDVVSLLLKIREMCFNSNIDSESILIKAISYSLSDVNNFFGLIKNDNEIILVISTIYEVYDIEIESLTLEKILKDFT